MPVKTIVGLFHIAGDAGRKSGDVLKLTLIVATIENTPAAHTHLASGPASL